MLKTIIYTVLWSAIFAWATLGWVTPPNSGYSELHIAPIFLGSFCSAIAFAIFFGVLEIAFKVKQYKDNYLLASGAVLILTALSYWMYV